MAIEAQAKKGWNVLKEHWMLFLLVSVVVVGFALYYDLKNKGALTQKYANAPIFGDKFKQASGTSAGATS
jgi:hypothetical protein